MTAASFDQILFSGRFDFSDPSKVVFSHVGNSIKANFNGTGISARFSSLSADASAASYFYVIIDGYASPDNRTLMAVKDPEIEKVVLAGGLNKGDHTIELVKETEYDTKVAFYGFTGESLQTPPARPTLRLEFYGDSNPAGWDAYDPLDAGAVISNGAYYAYPAITCRMLNAECSNISIGGIGITDKAAGNLFNFYHLINMTDPPSGSNLWDFRNYIPHAVVINVSSNDHSAGATKAGIKSAWKNFASRMRGHHPNAHIVIAESYGWSYNEPADYLAETIDEIKAAGETNISYVKFPWLWGQEHAVINEHAGFANILAPHLATVLNLPQPAPNTFSSFAPYGNVANGSFEKSSIPGAADGWRPHGAVTLIRNEAEAQLDAHYLQLQDAAWVNFPNHARPGTEFTVTGWMKGARTGDRGSLRLEFKDQAQKTVSTHGEPVALTTSWQKFTSMAVAPSGTWTVWVVLAAGEKDCVSFDDIQMTWR